MSVQMMDRRGGARVRVRMLLAALTVAVLVLTGCEVDDSTFDIGPIDVTVAEQPDIAALVPADIRSRGELRIGTNPPYQPNEFKDRDGKIIGFDVDVMKAVSQVLGLRPVFVESEFDRIIPAIQAGTFDMGMSSFTDTLEREEVVDFVTYFNAGVQWAQRTGDEDIDPDDACGLRVAVQTTTYQDTDEVPAKSEACVAAGREPIVKVKYDTQDQAVTAVLLGQADAFSADSPVTAYAVKKADGELKPAGPQYDAAPYGYPVRKGAPLAVALQAAVQYVIDHGYFRTIAEHWGVQDGMIEDSVINGASE